MRFVYPDIGEVFEWDSPFIPTLVIEKQTLFRKLLQDIYLSTEGLSTPAVLSIDNKPVSFSKHAELISDFIVFELNKKTLLNKVCSALERSAVSAEHYLETQNLLSKIEKAVNEWAFDFPCNINASKISVSSLLKAIGIELQDDYLGENGEAEKVIDYMELVREFDYDKLFITVNMRSYFSDEAIESFMQTVLSHKYKVLMIESKAHDLLTSEKRVTIDNDLCEF